MLRERIEKIQHNLKTGLFTSEAEVSNGVVLPLLQDLGWPVFDTQRVIPQYAVESRKVDFALCDQHKRPRIFLEVKRVGQAAGGDRQLFEYAFHQGIPFAILTDGQEWSFYLPGEEGHYEERRVYKLDLLGRESKDCAERLSLYLSHERVLSGEALEAARADYRDVARARLIEATLPKAWNDLLASQDSLLVELLADKAEDLCGYKPDLETSSRFLLDLVNLSEKQAMASATTPVSESARPKTAPVSGAYPPTSERRLGFAFEGKFHPARSAREVMQEVLTLLVERDSSFLDRFASRKHGTKRHFVSRDRSALYPDRPDLSEVHAVEFLPGWWLGTNYSKRNISDIIALACEVAQIRFGNDLQVNLG